MRHVSIDEEYARHNELWHWHNKPPKKCYLYIDIITEEVLTDFDDMVGTAKMLERHSYDVIGSNGHLYVARLDKMVYRNSDDPVKGFFCTMWQDNGNWMLKNLKKLAHWD